jgi:hypothetical protein
MIISVQFEKFHNMNVKREKFFRSQAECHICRFYFDRILYKWFEIANNFGCSQDLLKFDCFRWSVCVNVS